MGHIVLPLLRWYWHGSMAQERVVEIMPKYKLFLDLCKDLHMVDTSEFTSLEQAAKNKEDAFWKLGTIVAELNAIFAASRIPKRDTTMDEFTIAFKGRHRARCFNKAKPEKYHLKGFSLNEAHTGYCIRFYMYQGKDELRPIGCAATTYPSTVLIGQSPQLHHKGYILWADNWFTSVATLTVCMDVGVQYVGTARSDRIDRAFGLPSKPKGWTVEDRGLYRAATSVSLSLPVWVIQWQDRKLVSMLTTIEGFMSHTERKGVGANKEFELKKIAIPTIISAYNFGKVGTDRMDQQVACYYRNSRLRWHVKVFVHFMFIALHNAHVSYMDLRGFTVKTMPLLVFVRAVVDELKPKAERGKARSKAKRGGTHTPCTMGPQPRSSKPPRVRLGDVPVRAVEEKTAIEKKRPRWHCKVCNQYASTWCDECDTILHLNTTNSKKSCWSDFHSNDKSDSE
jgi:hypothetical protein